MSEYIITDEQAKEIVNQLPPYYVPTWLYLWVHTTYPNEPPFDWLQVREQHVGVNLPEVVRCCDCKHHEFMNVSYLDYPLSVCNSEHWEGAEGDNPLVEPNGFCAWGERK